jgi:glycosyltransferase involved in cell wall biosynthesis
VAQGGGRKTGSRQRGGGRVTPRRAQPHAAHRGTRVETTNVALLWQAPIFNFSGYGDEARAMILAMRRRGYPVTARSWGQDLPEFIEQYAAAAPDRLVTLHDAVQAPLGQPFVSVMHTPGYAAIPVHGAVANVIRTMFETDRVPPEWVPKLNAMDEVWVPTAFNVETFARAGVTAPIQVVPAGVDASMFRPGLRPLKVPGGRGTVFLSVFEWTFRKGWDVMLAAWANAFGPEDDVSLVLRTAMVDGMYPAGATVNQVIDGYLASLGRSRHQVAPIVVVDQPLGMADLPRLFAAADVYVSASRGEGWGRPMMEAMACRLPTIATRWSGNLDFMNDENSMLVDIEGVVPVDDQAEFYFYRGHQWAQPSAAHLTAILQRLAADPELRKRLGTRARSDIERRWQWHQVCHSVAERTDALGGRPRSVHHAGASAAGGGVSGAPHVRWEGDFYAHHSLAVVNRALTTRLAGAGVVSVTPVSREAPPFAADTAMEVDRVVRSRPPGSESAGPDVVVRHRWPPDLSSAGASPLVLVQPWEFGGIPSAWVPQIVRNVAEVWVPTTWVADCYVRSGVPASSVAVVPNGVDIQRFSPEGDGFRLATTKRTKLLFVGGTIPRKGIDVLLRSYLDTFGPQDDVCLVVKAFGAGHVYRGSTMDDQLRAVAVDPSAPEVELIEAELDEAQIAALYRSCDVLVHPYRGEGFGLPIAEAMASALPVVVTGYGACLDFCDEENAIFVPSTVTPLEVSEMGPSPIGYWWAEPDPGALGRILRRVVDDPSSVAGLGAVGRARIASKFTWDAAAALAGERLVELARRGGR